MNSPNPKKLQQNLLFFVIYYFCHHGRENLYDMKKDHFKLITDYDGTQYVVQTNDEYDKNHGPDDNMQNNEGRMYENPGKIPNFDQIFNLN